MRVAVRSTFIAGQVRITASAPGLKPRAATDATVPQS
jgi:hypothetical protein